MDSLLDFLPVSGGSRRELPRLYPIMFERRSAHPPSI